MSISRHLVQRDVVFPPETGVWRVYVDIIKC